MVYIKQKYAAGEENKEEKMLTRITLDKMNERYAGAYYSPKPSELPAPEAVATIPLTFRINKKSLRCSNYDTNNS
ncbi:hypothetical protein J0A71_01g02000 [Encephalitozoon cuniculi]|nr:hypothetical protein J0A71_01g02000 [Encephalitozoon cuniculi]